MGKKSTKNLVEPGNLVQSGKVLPSDDLIPIEYYMTVPHVINVRGRDYAFVVQHNVCMGMIQRADVDAVLALRGGCGSCGNAKTGIYHIPSETNVNIWRTGER